MRHVFLTRRYAFKFPRLRNIAVPELAYDLEGFRANRRERDLWRTAAEPLKSLLCPVVFGDRFGVMLVMSRAEPLTDSEYSELLRRDMEEAARPKHLRLYHGDLKRENYGTIDGQIVRVDYG